MQDTSNLHVHVFTQLDLHCFPNRISNHRLDFSLDRNILAPQNTIRSKHWTAHVCEHRKLQNKRNLYDAVHLSVLSPTDGGIRPSEKEGSIYINIRYCTNFGIHKMLVRIANREDPDQTASSEAV